MLFFIFFLNPPVRSDCLVVLVGITQWVGISGRHLIRPFPQTENNTQAKKPSGWLQLTTDSPIRLFPRISHCRARQQARYDLVHHLHLFVYRWSTITGKLHGRIAGIEPCCSACSISPNFPRFVDLVCFLFIFILFWSVVGLVNPWWDIDHLRPD